jgi:hypothetical protein
MLDTIKLLMKRLSQDNQLDVIQSGHVWRASFQWAKQASWEQVLEVKKRVKNQLPNDYVDFLTQISNGAILFSDAQYGQWGYRLFGTDELIERQVHWQKSIPVDWESRYFAFCELYGEAHVLVFDLSQPTLNNKSYAVVEASALDPIKYWTTAARSFSEWIDHLITAQGDKYWLWK